MPSSTKQQGRPLTHAKMAQPFVHAPLFRSFERGQQKKLKLDITYTVNSKDTGTTTFRFWGPEPLGATDLRVLQGLVAVATRQLLADGDAPGLLSDGLSQRSNLKIEGDALEHQVIAARFKLTTFARMLGYKQPGQATLTQLRNSIERLAAVTVIVEKPRFHASYHILSGFERDTVNDEVVVGLNPALTAAVLGQNEFLRVDFEEVRKLKSDAARLIHSRLHWINQGDSRPVAMETLCGYVYSDATKATVASVRQRHRTVRTALKELSALGWSVEQQPALGSLRIRRPVGKREQSAWRKSTVERSH